VSPGSKVIYWAAEKGMTNASNPWQAYGDFANAGVTLADDQGFAKLSVASPREYKVPSGVLLPKHIHYRVIDASGAMMGPVQTIFI
jgi:protocatechuate 3,4-dioxygenase beta subunit